METLLQVKNLSVAFEIDDKFYTAANNVSFDLKKGQMHAIIGESGCGKTVSVMSIINLLAKNAKITSGQIIFEGNNLLDLKEKELNKIRGRKIALIPQDPMTSLNPLYNIENQMVEAILAHKNVSKKEAVEIAYKSLIDVNIKDAKTKLKAYPYELSGGLRQRVIIATALCLEPEIIIADEPTTALDVTVQAQILKLLNDIKNKGKGIILISHDLGLVSKYADYISIMYAGRIVEAANTKTIFKNPKHPYTRALIEALPYYKVKRLKNIKGQSPSLKENITGCKFNPRCEFAEDICKIKTFELLKTDDDSYVACRLYDCQKPCGA